MWEFLQIYTWIYSKFTPEFTRYFHINLLTACLKFILEFYEILNLPLNYLTFISRSIWNLPNWKAETFYWIKLQNHWMTDLIIQIYSDLLFIKNLFWLLYSLLLKIYSNTVNNWLNYWLTNSDWLRSIILHRSCRSLWFAAGESLSTLKHRATDFLQNYATSPSMTLSVAYQSFQVSGSSWLTTLLVLTFSACMTSSCIDGSQDQRKRRLLQKQWISNGSTTMRSTFLDPIAQQIKKDRIRWEGEWIR